MRRGGELDVGSTLSSSTRTHHIRDTEERKLATPAPIDRHLRILIPATKAGIRYVHRDAKGVREVDGNPIQTLDQ